MAGRVPYREVLSMQGTNFKLVPDDDDSRISLMTPLTTKRNLISDLMELAEPMKVFLRVRSPTDEELKAKILQVPHSIEGDTVLTIGETQIGPKYMDGQRFTFTKVFDESSTQCHVYEETCSAAVKELLTAQDCLIFNYGITNAGKTFTMQGTSTKPGLIPCALRHVFELLQEKLAPLIKFKPIGGRSVVPIDSEKAAEDLCFKNKLLKMNANTTGWSSSSNSYAEVDTFSASSVKTSTFMSDSSNSSHFSSKDVDFGSSLNTTRDSLSETLYSVFISYIELYNESVFDLLIQADNCKKRAPLRLGENQRGESFVKGMTMVNVTSVKEAMDVLMFGHRNLHRAATKVNNASSRSHSIFTVTLVPVNVNCSKVVGKISQMSFCDLAGSERYSKTQSDGERLWEAGRINRSIMVLGRCIAAMRSNQNQNKENQVIVPFRESKLTRLLQGYFRGKNKVTMIVNVSPCIDMYHETINVLKFSAIAKEILFSQELEILAKPFNAKKRSLDLLHRSLCGRTSVPWEAPEIRSSCTTVETLDETNEMAEDDEDEEDTEVDEAAQEKIAKLLEIIEILKQRYLQEKKEKHEMEAKLRDEMSNAFFRYLSEMQDFISECRDEELDAADELADQRMESLAQFFQKKKRARVEDGSEENFEKIILERDTEISELRGEIQFLEAQNVKLKENVVVASKHVEEVEKKRTSAIFLMAQNVMDTANTHAQTDWIASDVEDKLAAQSGHIKHLEEEIEKFKASCLTHTEEKIKLESQIKELQQIIDDQQQAEDGETTTWKSMCSYSIYVSPEEDSESLKAKNEDRPEKEVIAAESPLSSPIARLQEENILEGKDSASEVQETISETQESKAILEGEEVEAPPSENGESVQQQESTSGGGSGSPPPPEKSASPSEDRRHGECCSNSLAQLTESVSAMSKTLEETKHQLLEAFQKGNAENSIMSDIYAEMKGRNEKMMDQMKALEKTVTEKDQELKKVRARAEILQVEMEALRETNRSVGPVSIMEASTAKSELKYPMRKTKKTVKYTFDSDLDETIDVDISLDKKENTPLLDKKENTPLEEPPVRRGRKQKKATAPLSSRNRGLYVTAPENQEEEEATNTATKRTLRKRK